MCVRLLSAIGLAACLSVPARGATEEAVSEAAIQPPTGYLGEDFEEGMTGLKYAEGLSDKALHFLPGDAPVRGLLNDDNISASSDFSLQCWVRTTARPDEQFVVLSQKKMQDLSLASQKQRGWMLGVWRGTWMWNIGSGNRRLTYLRDNGEFMPMCDGRWHQLAMTHERGAGLLRLYYDGRNIATYNLHDKDGFDFTSDSKVTIGWKLPDETAKPEVLPAITAGAADLQQLVDAFNALGLPAVETSELTTLVVAPERLLARRLEALDPTQDAQQLKQLQSTNLSAIKQLARRLGRNPYTIHQAPDFMLVAPLRHLYQVEGERVTICREAALECTARERLDAPRFNIDQLNAWDRVLSTEEIRDLYAKHFPPVQPSLRQQLTELTACSWNIHHGGIHETVKEDGWDSRRAIVDLIRSESIDIVMMQESYSNVDYIAAELGYYYATTVDWDYLNQGANISVLSRYPILDVHVPRGSSFMNVAAKIRLSNTQTIYAMSNWYGMNNFAEVFAYHEGRFDDADQTPVLFAGDFNAVPHTDGGKSPASRRLLAAGFVDAYREKHPDVATHPGASHRSGSRIDQFYYRGAGLRNRSTKVISTWPSIFPSDHYVIKTTFDLATPAEGTSQQNAPEGGNDQREDE